LCDWQAMTACWRTRTPLMVRGDSTLLMGAGLAKRAAKAVTHRLLIPRFDAYLVVGQRAREYYEAYGARADRMEFCPHAVDNQRFATAADEARRDRAGLRRRWQLDPKAVVFLFAGKLVAAKRPFDLVDAVKIARRRGANVQALVVGDGPLGAALDEQIGDAPVRCTGFLNQSRIPEAYAAADVVVLPSESMETWGLVVNEAMACGLPALVSDRVGCAPDLVVNGETGFVFACRSVETLADRMVELAHDGERRAAMARAAAEHIRRYSLEAAADGFVRAVARVARRA
ncbi:MAG: glycosyltransferase family 4 protein, partial [Myxococcales bacterium]|nr:glycosyltransferase family 4 protein [Myxococcales bacterium]